MSTKILHWQWIIMTPEVDIQIQTTLSCANKSESTLHNVIISRKADSEIPIFEETYFSDYFNSRDKISVVQDGTLPHSGLPNSYSSGWDFPVHRTHLCKMLVILYNRGIMRVEWHPLHHICMTVDRISRDFRVWYQGVPGGSVRWGVCLVSGPSG